MKTTKQKNRKSVAVKNNCPSKAEKHILRIEKERAKKGNFTPPFLTNTKTNYGKNKCGYDIKSHDRHIEVKSMKENETYRTLTPNQTTVMLNDSMYWVYFVVFNEDTKITATYGLSQKDLIGGGRARILKVARIQGIKNNKYKL